MSENTATITENRAIISAEDAERLRAKVRGMKRAALNMELQAKQFRQWSVEVERILDLIIEPDEL